MEQKKYNEINDLFEERLQMIQQKYKAQFLELEKDVTGASDIWYHLIRIDERISDKMVRVKVGLNNTSIAPPKIKSEIEAAIKEIYTES